MSAELWVRRCMIRMRQLDPQLALEDAEEIAVEMYEFERTGVMEPEAAVDFVVAQMREEPSFAVAQMRKEPLARLERRVANPRAAQADES